MKCPHCGGSIFPGQFRCDHCNKIVSIEPMEEKPPKNKTNKEKK